MARSATLLAPSPRLGAKGLRTRRRIMDATHRLLESCGYHDLRITDIAREADILQPNFYAYFQSLEDVICALAEDVSTNHLAAVTRDTQQVEDWAVTMVEMAVPLWRDNRNLFAIVGLLADKQHGDFPALRQRQTYAACRAFAGMIEAAQRKGRLPERIDPRIGAYACFSIVSSMCEKYALLTASGFTHDQVVHTTADMLRMMATGRFKDKPA